MPRRTKIIATLGPASEPEETLRAMIEAGCDVVRINLAHGTIGQAIDRMRLVRRLAAETGRVVGILADLPGPKVRLTEFVKGGLLLHDGDTVSVAPGTDPSGPDGLWVDYPLLIDDVGPGDVLTVGDGGVVAARDADYGAMCWYPADPRLDRWMAMYQAVARSNGAEPDAGRRLLAWANRAGLPGPVASASTWCFSSDEDRHWWGGLWADRVVQSPLAAQAVELGIADTSELAEYGAALREWAEHPDGWFLVPHGEILATTPR